MGTGLETSQHGSEQLLLLVLLRGVGLGATVEGDATVAVGGGATGSTGGGDIKNFLIKLKISQMIAKSRLN